MIQTTIWKPGVATVMALAFAASTHATSFTPSVQAAVPQESVVAMNTTQLNINTASANELSSVMIGVGIKRAEDIIKLREQLGGFTELEQLLDVKGIGLKTLEKNKSLIRIN